MTRTQMILLSLLVLILLPLAAHGRIHQLDVRRSAALHGRG